VSTEERCERHDMILDQCADCTGRDGGEAAERARKARLLRLPSVFAARWGGECVQCGEAIAVGDPMRGLGRRIGPGYVGACCITDDGRVRQ
jgi:hypothetical protein